MSEKAVQTAIKKQICWQYFSDVFMVSALLDQGTTDLKVSFKSDFYCLKIFNDLILHVC